MKRNGLKPITPSQAHHDALCHAVLDDLGVPREHEGRLTNVLGRLTILRNAVVLAGKMKEKENQP